MEINKVKTIKAIVFEKPNGRQREINVPKVYPDDADYINENNIKVSMEETGGTFVVYFDYGVRDEDNEPIEHIELSLGKTCEETIKAGVKVIKNIL